MPVLAHVPLPWRVDAVPGGFIVSHIRRGLVKLADPILLLMAVLGRIIHPSDITCQRPFPARPSLAGLHCQQHRLGSGMLDLDVATCMYAGRYGLAAPWIRL